MPVQCKSHGGPSALRLKVPQIKPYDRMTDLVEYIKNFTTYMTLHSYLGKITCRSFPLTLKGATRGWFEIYHQVKLAILMI